MNGNKYPEIIEIFTSRDTKKLEKCKIVWT